MHFTPRHFRRLQLIAVLWLGATGAVAQTTDRTEPVIVQLPESARFEFAGYYAAQAQGYFKAEGLEVEIRPGSMGVRPVAEVTGGAAQYGVEASALIVARLRGAPVVLVASLFQHSSLALAVLSKSGISMPADLQGKRVALDPHGSTPEIQAMLMAGGMTPVQYTLVPDEWGMGEIETGAAEAMVVNTWQAEQEFKSRGVNVQLIRPSDYGVDFYGDSLFTSETEARLNPERVEAMRRAILRGWHHALENPDEIIRWMLANLPNPTGAMTESRLRAEAVETTALINANLISIGHVNAERWNRLAELVVRTGLAPNDRRLKGFIYTGPIHQIPVWGKWLFGVFGLAVALHQAMQPPVGEEGEESERHRQAKNAKEPFAPDGDLVNGPGINKSFQASAIRCQPGAYHQFGQPVPTLGIDVPDADEIRVDQRGGLDRFRPQPRFRHRSGGVGQVGQHPTDDLIGVFQRMVPAAQDGPAHGFHPLRI